jgi:uncharacterized protein YlxW (UPF0749 family)
MGLDRLDQRELDQRELDRRRLAWRVGTPVVVLVCGSLLAISGANSEGTDLRPGRYTDLATLVQNESDSYQALEHQVGRLTTEVQGLANAVPGDELRRDERRVERLRDPAGLTPRSGPGVQIVLSDAPTDMIEKADEETQRLLIVHQQDIQAVVNALWRGGASAVTVQGKRIISTTGIKCSGSTVQLQGVPYPAPYVVRAVGDPAALTAAIDTDPDVSLFRADAADPAIGLGWQFSVEDQVTAPAYDGLLSLRYAQPLD